MESRLQSAAAFVEGGIQDSCDDSCSICLEEFSQNDPSTVTCCKHDFHLQCILEWCQRSSQCPMCWQAISLKDPTSQELLEAVEREKSIRVSSTRAGAVFHLPALGDFELQNLPVGANDYELEEQIIQHLAAAAAMRRSHHMARREGQHRRPSAHDRPQFLVFSTNSNTSSIGSVPVTSTLTGGENEPRIASRGAIPSASRAGRGAPQRQTSHILNQADEGNSVIASRRPIFSNSRSFAGQSSLSKHDDAGPSDFQSFSESLKSRLSAASMRYRDSISKSTRGWKERFFARNASMPGIGSEVRGEVTTEIATVSHVMEHLDMRANTSASSASASQSIQGHAATETSNGMVIESHTTTLPGNRDVVASWPASSSPS